LRRFNHHVITWVELSGRAAANAYDPDTIPLLVNWMNWKPSSAQKNKDLALDCDSIKPKTRFFSGF